MPPGPIYRIFLHQSKGCYFSQPISWTFVSCGNFGRICSVVEYDLYFLQTPSPGHVECGVWTFISGGGVPAAGNRRRQGGQEDKQDTLSSTLSLFTLPSCCRYHLCQSMLPKPSHFFEKCLVYSGIAQIAFGQAFTHTRPSQKGASLWVVSVVWM